MQPTGEPTPALRGKDATVVITPHRLRYRGRNALPAIAAVRLRAPNAGASAVDRIQRWARGRRTGTRLGRRPTSTSPPRPSTPRLLDAEVRGVGCGDGAPACRLPQAFFSGFLAIKSMRLFALRTVSIGNPPELPDLPMRSRWSAAAGQAGRRSCCRAGLRPNDGACRSLAAWRTSARPSARR
jgi:hypothetical protein